jgi:hypothetical protein
MNILIARFSFLGVWRIQTQENSEHVMARKTMQGFNMPSRHASGLSHNVPLIKSVL